VGIVFVPYHLDERLEGLDRDLPDAAESTVSLALPEGDVWGRLGTLYERVADEVSRAELPIVVSGDCMVSLGTMAGLQRRGVDAGIVWFDAHGDVQTLETTTSGYIGGMPLRILVGYRPELISNRIGLRSVSEERVVLVDARDLDPAEVEYLAQSRIRMYPIDEIEPPDGPLLVHVDLDVVDGAELPGLLFPVSGGPAGGQVVAAVQRLLDTGRVVAVDLACTWRPDGGDELRRELLRAITKGFRKETYSVSNSK
jgi:arginase